MSMTNEEKYLKERVGQENPFRTPEGYFDQFTANIMAQLPDRQPVESKPVAKIVTTAKSMAIQRALRPFSM